MPDQRRAEQRLVVPEHARPDHRPAVPGGLRLVDAAGLHRRRHHDGRRVRAGADHEGAARCGPMSALEERMPGRPEAARRTPGDALEEASGAGRHEDARVDSGTMSGRGRRRRRGRGRDAPASPRRVRQPVRRARRPGSPTRPAVDARAVVVTAAPAVPVVTERHSARPGPCAAAGDRADRAHEPLHVLGGGAEPDRGPQRLPRRLVSPSVQPAAPSSWRTSGCAQNAPSRTPMPCSADSAAATTAGCWPATVKVTTPMLSTAPPNRECTVTPGIAARPDAELLGERGLRWRPARPGRRAPARGRRWPARPRRARSASRPRAGRAAV